MLTLSSIQRLYRNSHAHRTHFLHLPSRTPNVPRPRPEIPSQEKSLQPRQIWMARQRIRNCLDSFCVGDLQLSSLTASDGGIDE